jgi:hypothetical protein
MAECRCHAREESVRGMVAAAAGQRFVAVIPPETTSSFPIVEREGSYLKRPHGPRS